MLTQRHGVSSWGDWCPSLWMCIKSLWIISLKWVNCVVCDLYITYLPVKVLKIVADFYNTYSGKIIMVAICRLGLRLALWHGLHSFTSLPWSPLWNGRDHPCLVHRALSASCLPSFSAPSLSSPSHCRAHISLELSKAQVWSHLFHIQTSSGSLLLNKG